MRVAALLILALSTTMPAGESIPYRLLIGDLLNKKIVIREKDGTISWEHPATGNIHDGARLANGNIIYCWYEGSRGGVIEVTPDHKVVFEHPVKGEIHTVQRLPDGNTLINDPANTRLIEIDAQGQVRHELKLSGAKGGMHKMCRLARKQADGSYLVAQVGDQAIVEYKADGSESRRIPMKSQAHLATRLPSGNLLIPTGNGKAVVELDASDKPVWSFATSDFPADANPEWTVDAQRLRNGNTLIVNWLGHARKGNGISILEVTPDKKKVWALREVRTVFFVQILE